jgi:uncharacterized protein YjiS (DUF1127 family)|tara:strand:+ start:182 stop:442 length:261 start_codon:yes stop_codon:yes gene_type:complete
MTQTILVASNWIQEAVIGFADLMKTWKRNRARKAMIARTYKELSQLTNHELRDLGIGRSDITSIANGTFHDNRMKAKTNANLRGWV